MNKMIVLTIGALVLSGCSVRFADMTVASSKNYNLNASSFVKGKRVIGEDSAAVIIVPTGIPNMKTAMDRAIEQDKCAVALTDVVMINENHSFLFGKIGVKVEGTLVIDQSQPGCENHR